MSGRAAWLALGVLLVVGTALRGALLPLPGHGGDVVITSGWAERMAAVGPLRFYEGSGAIYPALLYPLWAIGALLDGDALSLAIKGFSIPFDVAVGTLLFAMVRPRGERAALAVAAIYLLNPAVLLAGPVWGQLDAAGTVPFLLALGASASRREGWAGAFAILAALVKPQFGLVVLPVVAVAAHRSRDDRSVRPLARTVTGGLVAYAVVAVPLLLDPARYVGLLLATATYQPFTSLHAFNPWGLLVGFSVPDDGYVAIGTLSLLAGIGGAMLALRRGRDLYTLLAVGALLVLVFYFLPTRVHERYLFPAMALLAPLAILGVDRLIAYVTIALGFAASLLYALHVTTPFDLPEPLGAVIESPAAVWVIGLVLIGSAVAWTWLLLVRDPRPPPAARGGPAS